jgi:hypothetical protein
MIELIGFFSLFLFIGFLLSLQYSMMTLGVVKKDLKFYNYLIGWTPLLPFILMFLFGSYLLLKLLILKLIKQHRVFNKQ